MAHEIEAFFDKRTSTLTYVVWDPATRDAMIIDPVLDYDPVGSYTFTESVDEVSDFVREKSLIVHCVLETHAHADHLSGSQILRKRFEAPVVIGDRIREVQQTFKRIFDLPDSFQVDGSQFDRLVRDGEDLHAGSLTVSVIATPGHTPACLTYRIGDAVFTGDLLLMDDYGTGRCDFPSGSAEAMFDSVRKLYELGDDVRVFVGHDYMPEGRPVRAETTIGASKAHNPQLNARTTREEFVSLRKQRDSALPAPKLLFQSVQVNVNAGRLPEPHENGIRYFNLPLNFLRRADDLGQPLPEK